MRRRLGWIGWMAAAGLLGGGCGAGGLAPPAQARIGRFLPEAPIAADGGTAWILLGEGFGPRHAVVTLYFLATTGSPFEDGTTAILTAPGVIEEAGQIRGVLPASGVSSDHPGFVAARLELVLPDGRRATSAQALATFRPAAPPPPQVRALSPPTLLSGLPKTFRIQGSRFAPVGGSATLQLRAVAGRPFPGGAGSHLDLEVDILSPDELGGVLPHASVAEAAACVLAVRFPDGARSVGPEALATVAPGQVIDGAPSPVEDGFGASVAIDGATAIVGLPGADDAALDAGAAVVFTWDGRAWTERARLHAPFPAALDAFGTSVAIEGGCVAIGAPLADGHAVNQGAVHLFEGAGATWAHVARLTALDPSRGDRIGAAVAVAGARVAVGGPLENNAGGVDAGCVYLFECEAIGGWIQVAKLLAPAGSARDHLGQAIALDGATLVAGAPGEDADAPDAGGVHVFGRDVDGAWAWRTRLLGPGPTAHAALGTSVGLAAGRIVAGAPGAAGGRVEAFASDGAQWAHAQTLRPLPAGPEGRFGQAVALSEGRLLVGAPAAGRVEVFERRDGQWVALAPLHAAEATVGFGAAVALAGEMAVVGSPSPDGGAVHFR